MLGKCAGGVVAAVLLLGVNPAWGASAPGCASGRPATAHYPGAIVLSPRPSGAPVPCLNMVGPTNDSADVAVTPRGTIVYAPLATVTPAQEPAPADVAYPTDVARSVDQGAHWTRVVPSQHPTVRSDQHIGLIPWLYADPVTGRIWYATPTDSICGAVVSWSDDDGLTWTDNDSVGCPGQGGMSVFEGPAPAGQPHPVGYPHVVY